MPDDGNLVVVEGLHLSPVHVHVPLHVGGTGGARATDAEDEMSLISSHFRFVFELSPVDPFVVVDFVPAEEPVLPSSSAVLGRKRVERQGSSVQQRCERWRERDARQVIHTYATISDD